MLRARRLRLLLTIALAASGAIAVFSEVRAGQAPDRSPADVSSQSFQPQKKGPGQAAPPRGPGRSIAPRTFTPRTTQPRTYQPRTVTPRTYQPRTYQPRTYQPRSVTPRTLTPRTPRTVAPRFVPPPTGPAQIAPSQRVRRDFTIRGANRALIGGRQFSVWRGAHRVHRRGRWHTFVGVSALSAIMLGSLYYYPYAYIDAPADYCEGFTEDGCQLQWQEVPTVEGDVVSQCVAYCPWQ